MNETTYRYRLFGLTVGSEIELPELVPAGEGGSSDITISLGPLAAGLPDSLGFHEVANGKLLVVDGAGRFLAQGGHFLRIECAPGAPARNIRLFLLGSAMAMLLHQRGLLPLHANAVAVDGRAYVFMGPSGMGKSTLAAWFQDHGFPLLCDDVCVISLDGVGGAQAWPGLPRLRLWRDALERSGRDSDSYSRSFEEDDEFDKYDVPLPPTHWPTEPVALGGLFLLDRAESTGLELLSPAAAVQTLFANIYRGEYLSAGEHERQWRTCLSLATRRPVQRWSRPWNLETYDREVVDLLGVIRAQNER